MIHKSDVNIDQGFGLSIGSDFYFVVDRRARHTFYRGQPQNMTYTHGTFLMVNGSTPFVPINGVLARPVVSSSTAGHVNRGKINPTILYSIYLDAKVAYVMTFGRGIGILCRGGRSLFWSQSTPSVLPLPICKRGIFNSWSWSSSPVVHMLQTERRA